MSDKAEQLIESVVSNKVDETSINLAPGSDIENVASNLQRLAEVTWDQTKAMDRYIKDLKKANPKAATSLKEWNSKLGRALKDVGNAADAMIDVVMEMEDESP